MQPQWRQPPQSKRRTSRFLCFRLRRPTSPMPTNLNPNDPSSPKVSCIGQVRVKTSRRKRRRRARNEFRGLNHGEDSSNSGAFRSRSLRRSDHSWSWVHLPLGCACVALRRLIGSLFCGMWRCDGGKLRSTCCCCMCACEVCGEESSASGRRVGGERGGGCVAVVAEEKGKKSWGLRELEMVADKLEKERLVIGRPGCGYDDDEDDDREEDIDKNAMLLMRCRSDPTKMSALAACFVDPGDAIEDGDGEQVANGSDSKEEGVKEKGADVGNKVEGFEKEGDDGFEAVKEPQIEIVYKEQECGFGSLVSAATKRIEEEKVEEEVCNGQIETMGRRHSSASAEKERKPWVSKDMEGSRRHSFSSEKDAFPSRRSSSNREGRRSSLSLGFSVEKDAAAARRVAKVEKEGVVTEECEVVKVREEVVEKKTGELPDCLLLMMYEPKLSMEVSRETWVCTADFLRWQPRHWQRMKEKAGVERVVGGEEVKKGSSVGQCEKDEASVPIFSSEEDGSRGHFALLTRCKSEPARLSSATASQKGCFWKSRYEPTAPPPAATASGDVRFFAAAAKQHL